MCFWLFPHSTFIDSFNVAKQGKKGHLTNTHFTDLRGHLEFYSSESDFIKGPVG